MIFDIEIEQEEDGRLIAEIPEPYAILRATSSRYTPLDK